MSDLPAGEILRFQPAEEELFELRSEGDGMPTLVGHFAVFDSWTEIDSRFEGQFMERVSPGAFSKTFAENRRNMRVLFQHGKDPQIGEKVLGPIAELREEERGAYYEVPLYDTSYNRDLLPGLADNQYGASFRFRVLKDEVNRKPERSDHNPEGLPERTIQEVKCMEFGPVTFGAYSDATAGIRSATDWWLEQSVLGTLDVLRNGAAALDEEEEPNVVGEVGPDITPAVTSRSTRGRDFLQPRKEKRQWELP